MSFGLPRHLHLYDAFKGQHIALRTQAAMNYGVLDDIQGDIVNLRPHLKTDIRFGDLFESQGVLPVRFSDVMQPFPLTAEEYDILQHPHPWRALVGDYVQAPLGTGPVYGKLDEVAGNFITLTPSLLTGPRGPLEVVTPRAIDRQGLQLVPIGKELYEYVKSEMQRSFDQQKAMEAMQQRQLDPMHTRG